MAFSKAVLAAVALTLLQTAAATQVDLPPCDKPFTPFKSNGCFKDGDPRTLIYRSAANADTMTIDKCQAECKGNGFRFAGLEYYGECYCGNTVDSEQLDDSQCNDACNGDKTQTCGGSNALSIFEDPTFGKAVSDVTVSDYKPEGCYTDASSNGRALSFPPPGVNGDGLTNEKCIAACLDNGFPLAGTEFGGECWCGNVFTSGSTKADASECNVACKGDASETCGGASRLTVFRTKDLESNKPCDSGSDNPTTTMDTTTMAPTTTDEPTTETTTMETTTKEPTTTDEPTMETTTMKPTTTVEPTKETTTMETTIMEPVTTTKVPPTTVHTTALCTSTHIVSPPCEHKCGEWCAPPIPDWSNQKECYYSYKVCKKELASCWKTAGWPGSLNCFEFGQWCDAVKDYCDKDCAGPHCNKNNCWGSHGPPHGHGPSTTTKVYPCPVTTTKAPPPHTTTTTTMCPPNPTNICKQPSNSHYGYGPGNPVGGVPLPIVGCNDHKDEWHSHPFKLYTNLDTHKCPGYNWNNCGDACADACKAQYDSCVDVYVKGCDSMSWKRSFSKLAVEAELREIEARWGWGSSSSSSSSSSGGWGGSSSSSSSSSSSGSGSSWSSSSSSSSSGYCAKSGAWSSSGRGHSGAYAGSGSWGCWGSGDNTRNKAIEKCKAQYYDCRKVNKYVNPDKACMHWGCD